MDMYKTDLRSTAERLQWPVVARLGTHPWPHRLAWWIDKGKDRQTCWTTPWLFATPVCMPCVSGARWRATSDGWVSGWRRSDEQESSKSGLARDFWFGHALGSTIELAVH